MLSAAKVKIHGMQDERWLIRDKIAQFRGAISLYERDRKLYECDLKHQQKRYVRVIKRVRNNIDVKREELRKAVFGDKQFMRNVLQDHRKLQLAHTDSQAHHVLECIHQENFNRRKQLDRIDYEKKKRMETFLELRLQEAKMKDRILYEPVGRTPIELREQAISNNVQCANIKKNAALAIKGMYIKILDVLKKDSTYFTVVLNTLKLDCNAQSKCLRGATEVGQLCMEYLDDRKFEYFRLEREMKKNMRERARCLKNVQKKVEFLNNSFPKLIQSEDIRLLNDVLLLPASGCKKTLIPCDDFDERETKINKNDRARSRKNVQNKVEFLTKSFVRNLHKEQNSLDDLFDDEYDEDDDEDSLSYFSVHEDLENVKATCKIYQRATKVSTVHEVLPRLKNQDYQTNKLRTWLLSNTLVRDSHKEAYKQAIVILDCLKNEGQQETKRYLHEKTELRENIRQELDEKERLRQLLSEKGALEVDIRWSLQNLVEILSTVGSPTKPAWRRLSIGKSTRLIPQIDIQPVPYLENDLEKLISSAKKSITVLVNSIAKVEINPTISYNSRCFYQNFIMKMNQENIKEERVIERALIEFEKDDPSVPSHERIKFESKKLVDIQVTEFEVPEYGGS